MKVPADIREALTALMAEYAMAIDDNRLEDWVELFDEACDYKVVMRENVEQNLPNVLISNPSPSSPTPASFHRSLLRLFSRNR